MHLVANSGSVRTLAVANQNEDEESKIQKAAREQTHFLFGKRRSTRHSNSYEQVNVVMKEAIEKYKAESGGCSHHRANSQSKVE